MHRGISTFLVALAITLLVGLFAEPAQAGLVHFEVTFAEPNDVKVGQFHPDNSVTVQTFEDTDSDGMVNFTVDIDPSAAQGTHTSGGYFMWSPGSYISAGRSYAALATNDALRQPLIVFHDPATLAGPPLVLGQTLIFVDGRSLDWPPLDVRTNPTRIDSVEAFLLAAPSIFPAYTGEAVVTGLVHFTVIPEPATSTLALLAAGTLMVWRRIWFHRYDRATNRES
jgi:hypothetical protein